MIIKLFEDEPIQAMMAKKMLEKLGLEAHHFPTPKAFLEDIAQPANLYLIDWDQPDEKGAGKRMIEEIQKRFPDARIVILSGNISSVPEEAAKMGIPFLLKPYSFDLFKTMVEGQLGARA